MPIGFQKVISLTLILSGLLACVWHLSLTTLATDTAALNKRADEGNSKRAISDVYVMHRPDEKVIETNFIAVEAEFRAITGTLDSTPSPYTNTSEKDNVEDTTTATSAEFVSNINSTELLDSEMEADYMNNTFNNFSSFLFP